jgi:transposase
VWRWQKRYMEAGIKALFKDRGKGKRAGKKPISEEIRLKIITKSAKEFLRFLRKIDRVVAKSLDLHLILDNYKTHKTKEVQAWLAKHPRFKLHFTPTSSSWINLVERFFAEITGKRIRRGAFKSVDELEAAITEYLAKHNANPKPFKWTATADSILEKNARARARSKR